MLNKPSMGQENKIFSLRYLIKIVFNKIRKFLGAIPSNCFKVTSNCFCINWLKTLIKVILKTLIYCIYTSVLELSKLRKTTFVWVMSVWIFCLGEWFDPWWFWKSHKIMCVLLVLYNCHLLQLLLQWACNLRLWFYLQIKFNRRLLFIIHNDYVKVLKKRQTKFENTKKYLKRPRTTSNITLHR